MAKSTREIIETSKNIGSGLVSWKSATGLTAAALAVTLAMGSFYTVSEGHIGILTRFSKAIDQVGPGLHFKVPVIDGVKHIEVRERKNGEELSAATKNQLPMTAVVTVNWTVNADAGLELYQKYGSLRARPKIKLSDFSGL